MLALEIDFCKAFSSNLFEIFKVPWKNLRSGNIRIVILDVFSINYMSLIVMIYVIKKQDYKILYKN